MPDKPLKFSCLIDGHEAPYSHDNTWTRETTTDGGERLLIRPCRGHVDWMLQLSIHFPEPFCILYVQVVPRKHGKAGRYQSPFVSRGQMVEFFKTFGNLFENDGPADIWLASFENRGIYGQLVYDRHEVIYAYGPLDDFVGVLDAAGLTETSAKPLPCPHTHHYNVEYDEDVDSLLSYWNWKLYPLEEMDD